MAKSNKNSKRGSARPRSKDLKRMARAILDCTWEYVLPEDVQEWLASGEEPDQFKMQGRLAEVEREAPALAHACGHLLRHTFGHESEEWATKRITMLVRRHRQEEQQKAEEAFLRLLEGAGE